MATTTSSAPFGLLTVQCCEARLPSSMITRALKPVVLLKFGGETRSSAAPRRLHTNRVRVCEENARPNLKCVCVGVEDAGLAGNPNRINRVTGSAARGALRGVGEARNVRCVAVLDSRLYRP